MRTLGKAAVRIEEFYVLNDVCLDEERRIVVTEFKNNRIQVMSRKGETISILRKIGPEKLTEPVSCLPYEDNKLFVSERAHHCI